MHFTLYKLMIACLVAESYSQLFPVYDGCTQVYHDTTDTSKCTHTIYCTNRVNFNLGRHDECSNVVYVPDQDSCDPVSLHLKCNKEDANIPNFRQSYIEWAIYSLDLSINQFASVPNLESMPNLAKLKISKSLLFSAKLSNKNDLPNLIDVDYSENSITYIEVVPGEFEYKNLKKLNLSYNAFDTITDATFDLFPNLESLDLSHNFIYTLDILSFEGIKKLIYLNLSHNRVANLESSLQRLRYLIKLDLSHNILQTLKAHDFSKLVNIQEIKLASNGIHTIENHVFDNMAQLATVQIQDNALNSIDQDIFINGTMLTSVDLSQNRLKKLPKNLFKGKTIFDFKLGGNQLEGPLERGSFEGLGMVTELDLTAQYLTSVENYAFAGLQNLQTLLLINNKLETLGNYSFKGLGNLNYLDLSYNKISKLEIFTEDLIILQIFKLHHNEISHISSNNFIALGSLQVLDLSHNKISALGSNYFSTLQNIQQFKISDNPLCGSVEDKTFIGLSSLPSLDISGTKISKVKNGSLMGMTLLKDFNISHSNISELQYNSLSYAKNIITIDLSYNQISVFDVNTTDLENLEILMLNNNMLQVISQTLFSGLSLLRSVFLSHNHIKMIHKETFFALKNMYTLDLSYNPELEFDVSLVDKAKNLGNLLTTGTKTGISFKNLNATSIPMTKLEMAHSNIQNLSSLNLYKIQRLQTLVLSFNAVSKLEMGDLSNLTYLNHLDLSYNSIDYIQPGTFKENTYLHVLNISHNKLSEISHGIFQGLMHVQIIDFSFNRIKDLHRSRFYDIEQLNTLIVDNNEIEFISDDDFLGSSLTELSIGGNPLPCKVLYEIRRKNLELSVTAIYMDESKDNLKGVTCIKDGYTFNTKLMPESAENNKLLFDIKNLLYNITRLHTVKESIKVTYNDSAYLESITKQEQKMSQHSSDIISSIKNLSSITNLTSIINSNTNLLLGKILRVLSAKESLPTNKPIILIKNNATSDNLISYINKIKQDLEDTIAVEKQNVLDLDDKIEKLNSKLDTSTKVPVHEKLIKTNQDSHTSSIFTEVCVGLILVLLVLVILYKIYKSDIYLLRRRSHISTSSRRNIADCMETPQL